MSYDRPTVDRSSIRSRSTGSAASISRNLGWHGHALSALAALTLGFCIVQAEAGELVYKPINPNFGGNPFNDGILLGTANAQNGFTAKRRERDPTEQFVRSLQSRLFSGLANQVQDAIFGDDPQDNGSFTVGDQRVNFERGLETITLEISNLANGSSTVIEVPVIEVEEGEG